MILFLLSTQCTTVYDYSETGNGYPLPDVPVFDTLVGDTGDAAGGTEDSIASSDVTVGDVPSDAQTGADTTPAWDTQPSTETSTGDTVESPDASVPPNEPQKTSDQLAGFVMLTEIFDLEQQAVFGNEISVHFFNAVRPATHTFVQKSGYCELYLFSELSLSCGGCPDGEICNNEGKCQVIAEPVSAGAVEITGLISDIVLTPKLDDSAYQLAGPKPKLELFEAGKPITVTASGAAVEAFSGKLLAPSNVSYTGNTHIQLKNGQDYPIVWTPAFDSTYIEVVLQTGSPPNPPTGSIYCLAPDATEGGFLVAKELIDKLPLQGAGAEMKYPSFIHRKSRTQVETTFGTIELILQSRANVLLSHQ